MPQQTIPFPPLGVVDVWRLQLATPPDSSEDLALLSTVERERLAGRRGTLARRFCRAHAGMRRVLASYLGVDPQAVELLTPYGAPPRLSNSDLQISLAHSDDIALIAVAATAVGVDLEPIARADNAGADLEWMAALTLTDAELDAFRATAPERRARSWLRSWTRKEALLKAHGAGICDQPPAEVDVSTDVVNAHALVDLAPAPGYVGAVAVARRETCVVWRALGT